MKNSFFGCLFLFFVTSPTWALSEIEINGELNVMGALHNLPTGERGNSEFSVPSLFLNLTMPLQKDNALVFNIEGSESKDLTSERFSLGLRSAFLDLVSPFTGMHALRVGLVPQVWQQAQYEDFNYRFLGRTAWAISEKWRYLSTSDVGLSFMSELPQASGEWALSFTNGEGLESEERGPHKEVGLFARLFRHQPWTFSFNYIRGHYEDYGAVTGVKERAQFLLTYRQEDKWMLGFEVLYAQDPAEAITDFDMADGVGVTDWNGQTIQAFGASLYSVIQIAEKSEVLLRCDYLMAKANEAGKDLQTGIIGYGYRLEEDIKLAAAVDYTRYGVDYGPGVRDASKFELAAQVLF